MKYFILYNYTTGDSFGFQYKENCLLEGDWDTLEVAEENLKRIKEHYEYYQARHGFWERGKERAKILEDSKVQDWYVNDNFGYYCLYILNDKREKYRLHTPWCGYFETLHEIWIEARESEDGMSYEF